MRSPRWKRHLHRTRSNDARPILCNALLALREAPEWVDLLWFNEFSQKIMVRGRLPWASERREEDWTDAHSILTAEWLQQQGIHVPLNIAEQAVEAVARERSFHPVREYLAQCCWDGIPRIDEWMIRYLGAADTPYVRAVSARWLISGVARIVQPGCKADHCLILEGEQGLKKSTALRTLAGRWFTDGVGELGTKEAAIQLAGAWIIELPELDGMNRGDVARIKAFMSRLTDRYRPPYGRRAVDHPRHCIFAGTVNHDDYLRDETGGRRFWPVRCTLIDIEGLSALRDQLWAEAWDRYHKGEPYWLDSVELTLLAAQEQRDRLQPDPWYDVINAFIRDRTDVSVTEVLRDALQLTVDKWTQAHRNRVAACLKAAGWERVQIRDGSERQWRYVPRPASPTGVGGDT